MDTRLGHNDEKGNRTLCCPHTTNACELILSRGDHAHTRKLPLCRSAYSIRSAVQLVACRVLSRRRSSREASSACRCRAGTSTAERILIPARVALADYPQLRALAWQVHGTDTLTPAEALGIYERNARHLDMAAMPVHEQALLEALRLALQPAANTGASDAV